MVLSHFSNSQDSDPSYSALQNQSKLQIHSNNSTPDQAMTPTCPTTKETNINFDSVAVNNIPTLSTPYRTITLSRNGIELFLIIMGNCICSGVICACLFGFSKQEKLEHTERRFFTVLALLLSSALGFGIGFLCDRIGMLVRGSILQSGAYSVEHLGYILKGSLSSYFLFFLQNPTNFVVFALILSSICGRFAVAFLGFGFTIEPDPKSTSPALYRPDWTSLSISGAVTNSSSVTMGDITETNGFVDYALTEVPVPRTKELRSMTKLAQTARGIDFEMNSKRNASSDTPSPQELRENGKIERFLRGTNSLKVELSGEKVIHRYEFQDFLGTNRSSSNWEAVIESSCWRYDVLEGEVNYGANLNNFTFSPIQRYGKNSSLVVPPFASSFLNTCGNLKGPKDCEIYYFPHWRWFTREDKFEVPDLTDQQELESLDTKLVYAKGDFEVTKAPRGTPISIWVMGFSKQWDSTDNIRKSDENYPAKPFLFNCSISFQDTPKDPAVKDNVQSFENRTAVPGRILGNILYDYMIDSYVESSLESRKNAIIDWIDPITGKRMIRQEVYEDLKMSLGFQWGVSLKNQSYSEIWLAAYVGRYLANQLLLLNDLLGTIEIKKANTTPTSKLNVEWSRIGWAMGGMIVYQILLAGLALWYCEGKFELLDDISSLSSVVDGFSGTIVPPPGTDSSGEFKREGNGFRWELGKDKRE